MHVDRRPRLAAAAVAVAAVLSLVGGVPAARAEDGAPAAGDTVVGRLVQAYADPETPGRHHGAAEDPGLLSWIRTAPGETVRVPTEDLGGAEAGATVEVTLGGPVEDAASEDGLEPAHEVLSAEVVAAADRPPTAPATEPVNHPVRVVMVQPADAAAQRAADPTTLADVVAAVDGPVADYWSQQTGGSIRFGVVSRTDWIPSTATCEDPFALWDAAARAAGWTPYRGEHLLVYVPRDAPGCAYGLGTVSGSMAEGGVAYVQDTGTSVIAHELGHNLGLGHASALQCDRSVETGTCRTSSYADYYDVMGFSWERLGSLSAPHVAQVVSYLPAMDVGPDGGTYVLPRWDARTADRAHALRFTDADGAVYWLEYRPAGGTGRDSWLGQLGPAAPQPGVLLRRTAPGQDDDTLLLDGTPSASSGWSADVQVVLPADGRAVPVSGGDVTVAVRAVTPEQATVEVVPAGPAAIAAAAAADGGLGTPGWPATCGLPWGGCVQHFPGGSVYHSPATGAHVVRGVLLEEYRRRGDSSGSGIGYPTGEQYATRDGGWTQAFRWGRIHWSPATGAHLVGAVIGAAYDPLWGESGPLGYPVGDQYATANGGATQAFQHGRIHWSAATGAHAVYGDVSRAYDPLWGESGVLGYPVGERYATANGGVTQAFQNGRIHWSPATGGHAVHGEVSRAYDPLWGESGVLGYPVTDRYPTANGGVTQAFQNGRIHWSPATGGHAVLSVIGRAYDPLWGESGVLGYPVAARYPTAQGGWTQAFQNGRIHWSPGTGAHAVHGPGRFEYDRLWGESGVLGYPVTEPYPTVGGGVTQAFQNGRIHWSPATGAIPVTGAVSRAYDAVGGEAGRLGYPVRHGAWIRPDVYRQDFQGGSVTSSSLGTRVTYAS
ncbi:reprolysin-like metallopeptidase [Geodermatophilus sp. SYSU D00804]